MPVKATRVGDPKLFVFALRMELAERLRQQHVLPPVDHWTNLSELSGLEGGTSAPDRILQAIEEAYDEADVSASTRDRLNQSNREIGFYQARTIMLLNQEVQAPPSAPPSPPSPDDRQSPLEDSAVGSESLVTDASTTARIDLFEDAVATLARAPRQGIESDRAARTLGVLLGDRRLRRAGLRSVKVVI